MTTRQFKRTLYCMGVMGLWIALAAPTFATKDVASGTTAVSDARVSASIRGLVAADHDADDDVRSVLETTI